MRISAFDRRCSAPARFHEGAAESAGIISKPARPFQASTARAGRGIVHRPPCPPRRSSPKTSPSPSRGRRVFSGLSLRRDRRSDRRDGPERQRQDDAPEDPRGPAAPLPPAAVRVWSATGGRSPRRAAPGRRLGGPRPGPLRRADRPSRIWPSSGRPRAGLHRAAELDRRLAEVGLGRRRGPPRRGVLDRNGAAAAHRLRAPVRSADPSARRADARAWTSRAARWCIARSPSARTRGAVVLASNDERDFDGVRSSGSRSGGRHERGARASGPSAPRTPRRSCAGASRSSPSSSSRRRRWPWSPSRSARSACPRRTGRPAGGAPLDHPLLRRGKRAAPRLRPGGRDGNRARPAQDASRPRSSWPARRSSTSALSRHRGGHDSRIPRPARLEDRLACGRRGHRSCSAASGLAVVSTFLSALVAARRTEKRALRARRLPSAHPPAADRRSRRRSRRPGADFRGLPLRVLLAYDGAAMRAPRICSRRRRGKNEAPANDA